MAGEIGALIVAGAVVALPALYVLAAVVTLRGIDLLAPDRGEAPTAGDDAVGPELPKAA